MYLHQVQTDPVEHDKVEATILGARICLATAYALRSDSEVVLSNHTLLCQELGDIKDPSR